VGLFRRRNDAEVEPDRCPMCTERVPEGAVECAMCGADLRALLPSLREREREPSR
jgi:hypothetical protein